MRFVLAAAFAAFSRTVGFSKPGSRRSFQSASPFFEPSLSLGEAARLQTHLYEYQYAPYSKKLLPGELVATSIMPVSEAIPRAFKAFGKRMKRRKHPKLTWEEKFFLLRRFKRAFGHCDIPPGYVVGGFKLGGWLDTQRKEFKKHRIGASSTIINEKRIARLERLGVEWEVTPLLSSDEKGWNGLSSLLNEFSSTHSEQLQPV